MRRIKQLRYIVAALVSVVILSPSRLAFAVCPSGVQTCSTSYQVDQSFFGSGGELNAQSSNYKAKETAGELTVGNTQGTAYQAYAGFNTNDVPFLEFVVTGANIDLGYLRTSQVTTATGTFYVRAWRSGGYNITTASNPPTNVGASAHQLAPMTAGGASTPGTEQFGMNLIKNTNFCGAGCNLGADPQQTTSFSYGAAATGYNTASSFKYNKNDVIASSSQSTSVTIYTISYIFNISGLTPAGQYTFNHDIVVTATY